MTTLIATKIYTTVTFAPVQGFIEKSRKLRDLYGSSFILSYLAWCICLTAESKGHKVISPALPNVTQGMPNQIIVEGAFAAADAEAALNAAWQSVVATSRGWIESKLPEYKKSYGKFDWERSWGQWANHAWEFFCVQGQPGDNITDVRRSLNNRKHSRNWKIPNWTGESSTLSGIDGICYPGMDFYNPKTYRYSVHKTEIKTFFTRLCYEIGKAYATESDVERPTGNLEKLYSHLGEPIINPREELSIPELIKRLITIKAVNTDLLNYLQNNEHWKSLKIPAFEHCSDRYQNIDKDLEQLVEDLSPKSFSALDRKDPLNKRWQGWFLGDGDNAAGYMKGRARQSNETNQLNQFSHTMRDWGDWFKKNSPPHCRVIYAGGDDFMGIFHNPRQQIPPSDCIQWLSTFKPQIWQYNSAKPITVSIGFVWAAPDVPQREVLQHCRDAESDAKKAGRDRVALRILFNSGNHLQWICPWVLLEQGLLTAYCDRSGETGFQANWTHFYQDVAHLQARHAFKGNQLTIAQKLFGVYFPEKASLLATPNNHKGWNDEWWNQYDEDGTVTASGILGDRANFTNNNARDGELNQTKVNDAINDWVINLAKAGFHLCSATLSSSSR
jgi:CRISPR-associated protein Cmr2